jgi:hypothetical protein
MTALPEAAGAVARRSGVAALGERALASLLAVPGPRVVAVDAGLSGDAARLGLCGVGAVDAATPRRLASALVTVDDELAERARGFVPIVQL